MDCPKCGESDMNKDFTRSVDTYGSNIVVVWAAVCPECGYECDIEEEFAPTGWEQEV